MANRRRLMGTPTPETWPELHNLQWRKEYPSWPGTGLEPLLEARPDLGEDGIDLLCGLLEPQALVSPPVSARVGASG